MWMVLQELTMKLETVTQLSSFQSKADIADFSFSVTWYDQGNDLITIEMIVLR